MPTEIEKVSHAGLTGNDIHAPHKWEYADEAERLAATDFVEEDKYCIAVQTDDDSFWTLINTETPTWKAM